METWSWLCRAVVGLILIVSVTTDIRNRHISNVVTLPSIAAGLIAMMLMTLVQGRPLLLVSFVLMFLCSAGFCLILEKGNVWAAGDSKLFLAVTVWINGMVPPLWGTSLLIGWTAIIHTGMYGIRTVYVWWFMLKNCRRLSRSWHYPGSITIALASGVTLLLQEFIVKGW